MTVATVFLGMQIERCSNRRLLFFFCGIIESRSVTIDQSLVRSYQGESNESLVECLAQKWGFIGFPLLENYVARIARLRVVSNCRKIGLPAISQSGLASYCSFSRCRFFEDLLRLSIFDNSGKFAHIRRKKHTKVGVYQQHL